MYSRNIVILSLILFCNNVAGKSTYDTNDETPVVRTVYGELKGITSKSRNNQLYYSFRGIPYAQPPVGPLRFKAPEKPSKWEGVRCAENNPPKCIQKNTFFKNPMIEGTEDCLFINVYTPNLNTDAKLPVMVYIHWGGFFAGSSDTNYFGPEYFMDKGVIIVTFNYRLGIFGFLSTNDDASPGNYGLKDQVAALEWVQENIENFGGDKDTVTIFGNSAGSASVHHHVLSPLSKGLFHRAIGVSGNAIALWASPYGIELQLAKMQGSFVGCNDNETTSLVNCLRNVDASELVATLDNFKFFSIEPLIIFGVSLETKTAENSRPFITKLPLEYLRNGEYNKVPFIIGMTADDGILRAGPIIRQTKTRELLISKFNELMPPLMALTASTVKEEIPKVWQKLRQFYLADKTLDINETDNNVQGFINLYTDRVFAYPAYQSVLMHSKTGHEDLWFFVFDYKGQYSYGEPFAAVDDDIGFDWGVCHLDDLLYLFKTPAFFGDLMNNDLHMSNIMLKLWTNFAKYGNPTPEDNKHRDGIWRKIESRANENKITKNFWYLNVSGSYDEKNSIKLSMENGLYKRRMMFWEDLPLKENIEELGQRHINLQ